MPLTPPESSPFILTNVDDGTIPPSVTAHEAICKEYRTPNEDRNEVVGAICPFGVKFRSFG
jgi:hypothetical protein